VRWPILLYITALQVRMMMKASSARPG